MNRLIRTMAGGTLGTLLAMTGIAPAQADDTAAPTPNAPTAVTLWMRSPDTYHWAPISFAYTDPDSSSVTATPFEIRNSDGTLVHTATPTHTARSAQTGIAGSWGITWDGTSNGAWVPGGTYTVTTTLTDNSGHATPTSAQITLEAVPPATMQVVPTGTTNVLDFVATPPEGVQLRDCSAMSTKYYKWQWDGSVGDDGTCHTLVDASALPAGEHTIAPNISRWTPINYRPYVPPPITITVVDGGAPTVVAPADVTAYRSRATAYETKNLEYTVSDNSLVDGVAWVTDAAGTTVLPEQVLPRQPKHTFTWNGSVDDHALPPGAYTVHSRFTDAYGNTTDGSPVTLTLRDANPVEQLQPTDGESVLMGEVPIEFRPASAPTETVTRIRVVLLSTACCGGPLDGYLQSRYIDAPDADGNWRMRWPVGDVEAGDYDLYNEVTWQDPSGASHAFTTGKRAVRVDPVTIPLTIDATSDAPDTADVAIETSSPHSEDLDVTIDWGDGTSPEHHTVSSPYQSGTDRSHSYARGGSYTTHVTVTGSDTSSSASDTVTVAGDGNAVTPAAPTGVTATRGNQTLAVAWTAPDGPVSSYTVLWTADGSSWTSKSVPGTTTTLTGLVNGRLYAVAVRAVNAAGQGALSPVVYARPDAVPPPIASVKGTARSKSALISWTSGTVTASYGRPTGFVVQRYRASDARWVTVRTVGVSTRSVTIKYLTPGTPYRFRVRATNDVGVGTPSPTVRVRPTR
ncbi:fibronectin type III domain-containing protein [Nocardioides jejuensis]|uniref:fibronectin type III domain-containing protein n=1 Tax=Nocardioides jejuensis TaxID=2502782 RepID=UPI001404E756|nr:fibronectin type III domain-containing protein [Nocardioides jejuensis]